MGYCEIQDDLTVGTLTDYMALWWQDSVVIKAMTYFQCRKVISRQGG